VPAVSIRDHKFRAVARSLAPANFGRHISSEPSSGEVAGLHLPSSQWIVPDRSLRGHCDADVWCF
jgi:hypothetical protein